MTSNVAHLSQAFSRASFAYSCAALDKISAAQSLFYKTELLVLRFVYVTYIYYVVPSDRGPAYSGPTR